MIKEIFLASLFNTKLEIEYNIKKQIDKINKLLLDNYNNSIDLINLKINLKNNLIELNNFYNKSIKKNLKYYNDVLKFIKNNVINSELKTDLLFYTEREQRIEYKQYIIDKCY